MNFSVSILLNRTLPALSADLNADGFINSADLVLLLSAWGEPGAPDFDRSGAVDGRDLAHLLSNWTAPAQGAPVRAAQSSPPDWELIRSTNIDINRDGAPDRLDLRMTKALTGERRRAKFDVFLSDDGDELRHVSVLDPLDFRRPTEWTLIDADNDPQIDLAIFDPEAQSLFVFLGDKKYGFDSLLHVVIPAPPAASLADAAVQLNALLPEDHDWLKRLITPEEAP